MYFIPRPRPIFLTVGKIMRDFASFWLMIRMFIPQLLSISSTKLEVQRIFSYMYL